MAFTLAFCSNTSNPYFDAVLDAVCAQVRLDPLVELKEWKGSVRFPPAAIPYLKPDGVLVDALTKEEVSQLPEGVQVFGYSHNVETAPFPRVVNDDVEVGRMAAQALLDADYSHWMVFVDNPAFHARERIRGMREVADRAGVALHRLSLNLRKPAAEETFQDIWRDHMTSLETSLKALHPNTGIITTSEAMAAEVLETLSEFSDKPIPEELGLMVSDEVRPGKPALSSLQLDTEEVSRRLMNQIRRRIQTPGCSLPEKELVPPKAMVKGETLRPAATDPAARQSARR